MARTKQTARKSSGGAAPPQELATASCCSAEADPTSKGTRLPIPSEFPCNHAFLSSLTRYPSLYLKLTDKFHIEPFLESLGDESDKDFWRKRLTDKRMHVRELNNRQKRAEKSDAPSPAPHQARPSPAPHQARPSPAPPPRPSPAPPPRPSPATLQARPSPALLAVSSSVSRPPVVVARSGTSSVQAGAHRFPARSPDLSPIRKRFRPW